MARTPGKPSTNPLTGLAASWKIQVLNPAGTGDAAVWGTASVSDLANVIAGLLGQPGTMLAISGTPAGATVGTAYNFTPTLSGGSAPYTVTVTGLPAGLSRSSSSTGATTGTPTTAGTSSVVYTVTDSAGATATLSRTIVVSAAAPPINSASFLSFSSIGVGKAVANTHPNIAAQSFVADITFTTPSTFSSEMHLLGAWGDNFYGHNEWFISLLPSGKPQIAWTSDGQVFSILSPTLSLPAGAVVRLRIAANVAAGSAEFFTIDSNGTANSLGLASGQPARSVRYDATNGKIQIGQSTDGTKQYTGNVYAASLSVGGSLVLNPVASNGAFSDTTGTVWTLTQADPFVVDLILTPNYPTALPPVNSSATPAFGTLASGASNLLSIDYTPGTGVDKVNTRAALDAISFYNHIAGSLDKTTGTPIDDPSNGSSFAFIGRYPESSPANVHQFTSQGLKLAVVGKNNNLGVAGDKKFSKGELRSAFIRLEQNFLPGMYLEFTFKGPVSPLAWQPIWLYQGRQISPRRAGVNGPYDKVTNQFGTNLSLYDFNDTAPNGTPSYHEIDILDMFNDAPGVGRNLTSGVVLRDIDPRQVNPYTKTYLAGSGGFTNDGYHAIADVPWNTGMNVLGFNWLGDGSNILQYILNGVVFMEEYWEHWSHDFKDPITGVTSKVGMCLLMGGQGVPSTFGTTAGPTPTGPVTISNMDDMSITIGRVRAWNKNIVSGLTRPTTNGKAGVTVPAPGVVTS